MPKIKTNSGAKKRLSITATGKIKRSMAGRRHLLLSNSAKKTRTLRKATYVEKANLDRVKKMLPYGL